MQNIHAVIFDLGQVILNIDYARTEAAMNTLFPDPLATLRYGHQESREFYQRFERGEISAAEFRAEIRAKSPLQPSDLDIDAAWNAMLLDLPEARLNFLASAGKHRRLFLFSNINAIHHAAWLQILSAKMPLSDFQSLFEACYYSHEWGFREPESRGFRTILERHNLSPQTTLFIDDLQPNVAGAKALEIQGFTLEGPLESEPALAFLQKPLGREGA